MVFAADIPKLDRALSRALPPDVDAALMATLAKLDDPFARTGLQVLRGPGDVTPEDLGADAAIKHHRPAAREPLSEGAVVGRLACGAHAVAP